MDHRLKLVKYLIEGKKNPRKISPQKGDTPKQKSKRHIDHIIALSDSPSEAISDGKGGFVSMPKWEASAHEPGEDKPDIVIMPRGSTRPEDAIAIEAKVISERTRTDKKSGFTFKTKPGHTEKGTLHLGPIPGVGDRFREYSQKYIEPKDIGIDDEELKKLVARKTHLMIVKRGNETHVYIPHEKEEHLPTRVKKWLNDTGLKVTHTINDLVRIGKVANLNRGIRYSIKGKPIEGDKVCPIRMGKCIENTKKMEEAHKEKYPSGIGDYEQMSIDSEK